MSTLRTMQPSFTAGELSPDLWARVDVSKYVSGLKVAKNVFVHAHGGVSNRAGTQFIAETRGSQKATQIPFIFDADTSQTYNLIFTDLKMRVLRAGSPVLEAAKSIAGISQANPGVVTSNAHGYANGDEVVLLSIGGMTALSSRNFVVRNVAANTFTLEDMFGATIDTSTLPAYSGGGTARRVYEMATPYVAADLPFMSFAQEKDVMFIVSNAQYAPRKLSRLADDNWTLTTPNFAPSMAAPTGLAVTAVYKLRTGDTGNFTFKVTSVSSFGAESAASSNSNAANFQYQNEDGQFLKVSWNAVAGAARYRVYRSDDETGRVAETTGTSIEFPTGAIVGDASTIPSSSAPGAPSTPTGVVASVEFGKDTLYVVSAVNEDTGEESLPSPPVTVKNDMSYKGNRNDLTWNAVAGASRYYIYRRFNGLYGYVGASETTSFTDENITPDIADGPQEGNNPFDAAGKYPRAVTFHEQRLAFAGTLDEPSAVYLGQSGNYENFGAASPAKDSDAITFRVRSREKNEIRSMVSTRGLSLFSSAAEWIVSGGSEDFLNQNPKIQAQSYRGASYLQPIVVGNVILFPQARGGVVRDFSYQFAEDGFTGSDLTIMARHLFEGRRIVSWAYAQSPHSVVWAVMNDGGLLSLTYMREHEVWAWTHHETDGLVEDVMAVPESGEDAVYLIVKRVIKGQDKRYIERLHSRAFEVAEDAFFVDCGLSYEGAPTGVVRGLHHLEGKSVVALSNGDVVRGLTVTNGAVTLPNPTTKLHVGLPYSALIKTLDLDLGAVRGIGSVQGRPKTIAAMTLRIKDSRGLFVGPSETKMTEYKQRSTEAWNEAIRLYTGDIEITVTPDWTKGGTMVVRQDDPLPMTILGIMPDILVGA